LYEKHQLISIALIRGLLPKEQFPKAAKVLSAIKQMYGFLSGRDNAQPKVKIQSLGWTAKWMPTTPIISHLIRH